MNELRLLERILRSAAGEDGVGGHARQICPRFIQENKPVTPAGGLSSLKAITRNQEQWECAKIQRAQFAKLMVWDKRYGN